ncbi:MAG: NUDIX domain-containing protein [Candidatus Doudnabacteria bacterium]|jgi:ADP-ribose pyrophosphatase YjhB (NUDIX family)
MELQVGVKILLQNSDGKYLLVRRNPKKYPEVGPKWDIVGGRINAGTTLLENLKREIKEEVGLEYTGEPKLVAAQDILVRRYADSADSADTALNEITRHVVRLTFLGEIEGEPKIDEDHLEAGWFSAKEIKNFDPNVLDGYFRSLVVEKVVSL